MMPIFTIECPACGCRITLEQPQKSRIKCPDCYKTINTLAEQGKSNEFFCKQCGVRLFAAKGAAIYVCPACNFENNVQERLTSDRSRKDGLSSIIKYEGDAETLVWKHPIEDFNMGSQLIVHESQEAIFFRDGQALDLFGAGRYTLETQKLPLMEKFYRLPTDAERTFHAEVYYINLATQMGIKWGTDSKVRLFDPASGLHIELGACGEFNIRVVDSRRLLLKVVGTAGSLKQSALLGGGNSQGMFRAMVTTQVKSYLAQTIKDSGINILEIDAQLMTLSSSLRECINKGLADYGLTLTEFFVSRVVTPDDDPNYKRLREQYAERFLLVRQEQIRKDEAMAAQERKAVEAQTAAQMKIISAQGDAEALKIRRSAEAESYRMQAEAEAAEMRIKGYTYQQETARKVGLEAMKNGIMGTASSIGELTDLVSLGSTSGVIEETKDVIAPIFNSARQVRQNIDNTLSSETWSCICGQEGISGNFCFRCGSKRPIPAELESWDCICGQKGVTGNFCSNCGAKRSLSIKSKIRGRKGIVDDSNDDFKDRQISKSL